MSQKLISWTFGNNNSNISNVDLVINGLKIEQLKTVKFLGVFIDEDMKWKSHISNIKLTKCFKKCWYY